MNEAAPTTKRPSPPRPARVRLSRRRVFGLAASAALVVAGCGVPPVGTPTPAPPRALVTPTAAPTTTVLWSFWGDEKQIEINRRISAAFEATERGITIAIQHEPWPTYFTRLTAGWARGEAPAVMFINNIPVYARTGALENLEPLIARDTFDVADIYPTLLDRFRHQGALHGLPRDNDTKVIYYNRRLLDGAAPWAAPGGWNWEQFRALARRLNRRDTTGAPLVHGFSYEARLWWRLWVWQNGGDILDDHRQPTRVRLGEPAAVEAIQFLANLTIADQITPPYEHLVTATQRALFRDGRLALMMDNHSFVPTAAATAGLQWDVAPLPRGQRQANLADGAGYALSAWTPHKEAAWTFLRFLAGPAGQALFAESGVAVPARKSIREQDIFSRRQAYTRRVFFEETANGVANYAFPGAAQMDLLLDEGLAPVFQGREAAAAVVPRLVPRLAALIATAGA